MILETSEAERRDRVLRAFVRDFDWELDAEQLLRRHLVLHSGELLARWTWLVGVEWRDANGTPGDLLFFDGDAGLAAVELKSLHSDPTKRRGVVERQARDRVEAATRLWPGAEIVGLVYTTDEHRVGAPPRPFDDRRRW